MQIIGITGTFGAGKGEVVEYLKRKGFSHFSVRNFLFEEIRRRGMPENRDSTNFVGEDLRAKHGASYVIESLFKRARESGNNCILESVRTVGEVRFLKSQPNAYLLAVTADPKLRYERISRRKSSLDDVSFEKFIADEKRESNGTDPARMNLRDCIAMADFVITNEGSKEELYQKIDAFLQGITPM